MLYIHDSPARECFCYIQASSLRQLYNTIYIYKPGIIKREQIAAPRERGIFFFIHAEKRHQPSMNHTARAVSQLYGYAKILKERDTAAEREIDSSAFFFYPRLASNEKLFFLNDFHSLRLRSLHTIIYYVFSSDFNYACAYIHPVIPSSVRIIYDVYILVFENAIKGHSRKLNLVITYKHVEI